MQSSWIFPDTSTGQLGRQLGKPGFSPANSVSPLVTDKRIYRLPVFTEQFCQAFVDELENFEQSDMPKGRPNTMNNYGVGLISCVSAGAVFTVLSSSLLTSSCSKVSLILHGAV